MACGIFVWVIKPLTKFFFFLRDQSPIPIVKLQRATLFSKLDLRVRYHQNRVNLRDIPETTFRTHDDHF